MCQSRNTFAYLAASFALLLLASACGGTSGSPTVVADQASTTVAAATDDTTSTTTPSTTTTTSTTAAPAGHDDDAADTGHDEGEALDDAAHAGPADRVVEVAMDDFTFSPDRFVATAGETVTFVVTNVGVVEHEFRLSNEHRIEEHMADGHSDDDHDEDAAGGHHENADMFLHLEAGASGEMTVTFPMDMTVFTEVACLIPGHYEAGMAAELEYSS